MTPAGTSNELDVQNEREENTHTHTPACVAPRHVDAPRDFLNFFFNFLIFSPNEQRAGGGGGGGAARLFLFLFFPVQQTTSGIGHRVK